MGAGERVKRAAVCSGVGLLAFLAAATPSRAGSVRVPSDYFGVNFTGIYQQYAAQRDRQLTAISDAGLTQVRLPIGWNTIEPNAPDSSGHHYSWSTVDSQVLALAQHGLQAQGMFAYAPAWATNATVAEQTKCRERGAVGLAAGAPVQYAAAAKALAQRYGPGGAFWSAHSGVTPQPIRRWEVWNAPNTAGTWCPKVDPEGYAIMFMLTADAIRSVNPNAEVVVGGVGIGAKTQYGSVSTPEFLDRIVRTKPGIVNAATAVGVHIYPGPNLNTQLNGIVMLRGWLRDAGFPDRVPMLVNEVGFTRVGDNKETEPERVASYQNVTTKLPRTNCNISGVLQYTWTTREQNLANPEDFFGIANWGTAALEPSAVEYSHDVRLERGELSAEAPTATIEACPGMPKPDTDGDGTPDESDYYPLDPQSRRRYR